MSSSATSSAGCGRRYERPSRLFEPGVWMGLEHDAVQRISYDGILECWDEGCRLLGDAYKPRLASVHDPDEYLAAAKLAR